MRLLFDIETNGLLDQLDKVHCLVVANLDTGEMHTYVDNVEEGLELLSTATYLTGHNVCGFDLPALEKVYGWEPNPNTKVEDTLLMSKLVYSDIRDRDFSALKKNPDFPKHIIGRHGLEAWGHRLGEYKGDYAKDCKAQGIDPWAEVNDAMIAYCEQDVRLNVTLWKKLTAAGWESLALDIEHRFMNITLRMERDGSPFDTAKATKLYATLCGVRAGLLQKLQSTFPPFYVKNGKVSNPAKSLKYKDPMRADRTAGAAFTPVKLVDFNPSSRDHISNRLIRKYHWEPKQFTNDGRPKVDDEVLTALDFPEAKLLGEYLMIQKRIGQLAEGNQAWLKLERNGRIYGRIDTVGTRTRRCSHQRPNTAQVPSVGKPWGKECRELFRAPQGWRYVGWDASGLELRCLSHYLARYDGGDYGNEVVNGDIHTVNQKAMGLSSRSQAKVVTYATLYGAGNSALAAQLGASPQKAARVKARWFANIPALKQLLDDVKKASNKRGGKLRAIDGGVVLNPSEHAALNTLLQSAGSIAVKLGTVLFIEELERRGLEWGEDFLPVAHVHDEVQLIVRPEHVGLVKEVAEWCMTAAGEQLGFRVPLASEAKEGANWAETH